MTVRRDCCLLCKAKLVPLDGGFQQHPEVIDCYVRLTDAWGVSLSDAEIAMYEAANEDLVAPTTKSTALEIIFGGSVEGLILQEHPLVDDAVTQIFEERGLPRLGGPSTGKGWSSFALWQRCPYAWRRRYLDKAEPLLFSESPGRAIGTLIHVFLALHYAAGIAGSPYKVITADEMHKLVLDRANPIFVNEAWRVFNQYRLYYKFDTLIPLAVEYDLKDPRTGESCRYDLIAYLPKASPGLLAGTYLFEHKSSDRFDMNTLDGWANDGEVIGEGALWRQLGLDHRFGPLRGAVVNILGKQKEPKFHRTVVSIEPWLVEAHFDDLRRWEGIIQLAKATDSFPRSRNNCINRYGRCDWWEHCATGTST